MVEISEKMQDKMMEYLYSIFGENGVIEVYDDDGQIVQKAFKFE